MLRYPLAFCFVALASGCGPSVESVCRDSCAKAKECNFELLGAAPEDDKEVEICQARCDALQLESDLQVERGQITEACRDRTTDFNACVVDQSCAALRGLDLSDCRDEGNAREDACN